MTMQQRPQIHAPDGSAAAISSGSGSSRPVSAQRRPATTADHKRQPQQAPSLVSQHQQQLLMGLGMGRAEDYSAAAASLLAQQLPQQQHKGQYSPRLLSVSVASPRQKLYDTKENTTGRAWAGGVLPQPSASSTSSSPPLTLLASPAAGSGGTSSNNLAVQQLHRASTRGASGHSERYTLDHDGSGGTGGAPVVDATAFMTSRSSFATQLLQ